eukprot:1511774-Rhodomonas_salina.2
MPVKPREQNNVKRAKRGKRTIARAQMVHCCGSRVPSEVSSVSGAHSQSTRMKKMSHLNNRPTHPAPSAILTVLARDNVVFCGCEDGNIWTVDVADREFWGEKTRDRDVACEEGRQRESSPSAPSWIFAHKGGVTCLRWLEEETSRDGRLVSGGGDGLVCVWEVGDDYTLVGSHLRFAADGSDAGAELVAEAGGGEIGEEGEE